MESDKPVTDSQFGDQNGSQPPEDPNDEISEVTDGVKPTEQDALLEEEGDVGGFQLEADSEEEGDDGEDVTPRDDDEYLEEDDDAAPTSQNPTSYDEHANRRELITDTGEEYS